MTEERNFLFRVDQLAASARKRANSHRVLGESLFGGAALFPPSHPVEVRSWHCWTCLAESLEKCSDDIRLFLEGIGK